MRAGRRTTERCSCLRGAAGYSLVEMMVAIGVAVIVGLGIYAVFNYSQKSSLSQKIYTDMQTGCNFAMDQMKNELLLAGYRARDQVRPISSAGASSITFEYYDDNARDEGAYAVGYDNNTQVTYRLQGGDLLREMKRHIPGGTYDGTNVTTQKLASNVASLSFTYFAGDNAAWSGADTKDIRTIRPTLTCNAARPDPNTGRTSQLTLTAEVRARNVGVASVATDTTPPATPTGLISWDPGECGKLELRWNANTDADLEGYTIYYGLGSGSYSERMVVARAPKSSGQVEYLTITGLDSAVTGVTPEPQYYFAINAYDKSGNISGLSTEVGGNPATSARSAAEAAGGSDTTVHPLVPAAPVAFTATPGDNSVTLTWTKSPATGLVGYRLYRSQTGASFAPVDPAPPSVAGNRIANENTLKADTVTFTDTGLVGCTTYYYKLTAIACDAKVPLASRSFSSATGVPTDATKPSAPVIAARPGYRRIILTLTNPVRTGPGAEPDFSYTKVYWSKTTFPVLNADGTVTPNQAVPRFKGPTMPNTPSPPNGTFSDPGSNTGTINFNDETDAGASAPNLAPDTTYFFRAVAYDLCGNHSDATSSSTAQGTQCGDCLNPDGTPDPVCYGNNGLTLNNVTASGCYGYIDISWDMIDDTVVRDFQGFRLLRREGASFLGGNAASEVSLTGADAAWLTRYRDASVFPGQAYSYRLMATDCYYEQHHGKASTAWPEVGNNPDDNFADAYIPNVSVGQIEGAATPAQIVTGYLQPDPPTLPMTVSPADGLTSSPPTFEHNTVTLWLRNTAASDITLQQFAASWENPQAYLQQVAFGDGNTSDVLVGWKDTATPLTQPSTGSAVTLDTRSRLKALDDQIPFVTLYENQDGSVNRQTDSRQQSLEYTLTYRNESTATDGCNITRTIYVPLGPYLYGTTQDKPSAGTRAWAVPGDQGGNALNAVAAGSGTKVNVYANVFDSSGAGISAVKLYYYVDAGRTLTAAPAVAASARYPDFPPYTAIDLAHVAGNQWRTPVSPSDNRIPAANGGNVWYFIVAVDNEGNFDREPEVTSGAFQYYQLPSDPCQTTPNPPPTLAGVTGSGSVALTWTAPTTNTDGSTYNDAKGFRVYRSNGSGWAQVGSDILDPARRTYTDSAVPQLDLYSYQYYVTAIDTCSPTPRESYPSPIYTDTLEGACNNTPSPPTLAGSAAAMPDEVTLNWTAPTTNAAPSTAPLTDLAGYEIWRQAGSGAAWAPLVMVGPTWTSYTDNTALNIKNVMYSYYVKAFDSCTTPGRNYSAPSNIYTESLVNNPCDETPNPATLSGSTNGVTVTLTWVPPTHDTNGEIFQDPGGYRVWRSRNGDAYSLIATTNSSTYSYTDSTVATDIGTAEYSYYVTVIDSCSTPNESAASNVYTEGYMSPCGTVPTAPLSLTVTGASASGVTLTWSPPSPDQGDIAGYQIERRDGSTGAWVAISNSPVTGGATTVTDGVTDAATKTYSYHVRAFDSCATPNYGPWSAEVAEAFDPCATSLPNAPSGLTVTAADDTGVTLSWSAPSPLPDDIGGYEVEYLDGSTGTWTAIVGSPTTGPATTVKHVIGTAGTHVYYYRVRAYDQCATKSYSPWSATVQETYVNDPCTSFPTPGTPSGIGLSEVGHCRNAHTNNPEATQVTLSWTSTTAVPTTPAGVSMSFEIYTCSGTGCTPSTLAGVCGGTAPYSCTAPGAVVVSNVGHGNGSNVNIWTADVDMGGFLTAAAYSYSVVQVYSSSSCVHKSAASATVSESCQ